jgi:hypothetical protein
MFNKQEIKTLAFPGAAGFGKYISGARHPRGASVYLVTHLGDSGAGSLRAALEASGPRYIIPVVGGTIYLEKDINVYGKGHFSLLGQTAPYPGITLANAGIRIQDNSNNFIIRYIRIRHGDKFAGNRNARCLTLRNVWGGMIDHCSLSWAMDENISFHPCGGSDWQKRGISVQYCTIAEPLNQVKGGYETVPHGFNMLLAGNNISYHHNLLIHSLSRNPQWFNIKALKSFPADMKGLHDFRNNLVYNYQYPMRGHLIPINLINNLYIPGPKGSLQESVTNRFWHRPDIHEDDQTSMAFVSGNRLEGYTDSWKENRLAMRANGADGAPLEASRLLDSPHAIPEGLYPFDHDCNQAAELIMKYSGMNLFRDVHDQRYMRNVKDKTFDYPASNGSTHGMIDSQKDVGGWWEPETMQRDFDMDGISRKWKLAHGLEIGRNVANSYTLSEDYPNIEVYANDLVKGLGDSFS